MNAEPKRRWRRRAEDRPDEILDAAIEVFNESGFEGARVEDIARRAGISKAGLYLYFDSKEDLLRALIEREIAPVARKARSLAEEGVDRPLLTLGAIIAGFLSVVSNPRFFAVPRIVLSVAGRFPELGEYYREHVVENGIAAFEALHRAGVRKGVFREANSADAARFVIGPVIFNALWLHVLGGARDPREPADHASDILDMLLKGLGAENAA